VATLRDEKRKLLALNLPQSNEVRRELEQYMNRTGLATSDFARRINYSVPSLQNFITGRYEAVSGSDVAIRAAIKDFINSHPIARATEIEGTLYDTANVRAWRSIFYECLDRRRAAVVYGPPGIQKSYPVESLIAELNAQEIVKDGQGKCAYYLYCPMRVRPNALLKLIAEACGSSPTGDNRRIIRNLRFDFGKTFDAGAQERFRSGVAANAHPRNALAEQQLSFPHADNLVNDGNGAGFVQFCRTRDVGTRIDLRKHAD